MEYFLICSLWYLCVCFWLGSIWFGLVWLLLVLLNYKLLVCLIIHISSLSAIYALNCSVVRSRCLFYFSIFDISVCLFNERTSKGKKKHKMLCCTQLICGSNSVCVSLFGFYSLFTCFPGRRHNHFYHNLDGLRFCFVWLINHFICWMMKTSDSMLHTLYVRVMTYKISFNYIYCWIQVSFPFDRHIFDELLLIFLRVSLWFLKRTHSQHVFLFYIRLLDHRSMAHKVWRPTCPFLNITCKSVQQHVVAFVQFTWKMNDISIFFETPTVLSICLSIGNSLFSRWLLALTHSNAFLLLYLVVLLCIAGFIPQSASLLVLRLLIILVLLCYSISIIDRNEANAQLRFDQWISRSVCVCIRESSIMIVRTVSACLCLLFFKCCWFLHL